VLLPDTKSFFLDTSSYWFKLKVPAAIATGADVAAGILVWTEGSFSSSDMQRQGAGEFTFCLIRKKGEINRF